MLQAFVRCQGVLRAVSPVTELAHVERVGLLVLVLEVSFERVVAGERSSAVRTLLRLVDSARCRWRHPELRGIVLRRSRCRRNDTALGTYEIETRRRGRTLAFQSSDFIAGK